MDILIVVICVLFLTALLAALIFKAVAMAKQMKRDKEEIAQIQNSDAYLLDIVQAGKTVRIECKDVNSDNVELISANDRKQGGDKA